MFFYQITLLSNNHVLMSYLSGIYLESWFSWLDGWVQKTLKKKKKTHKRKTLKNEEKEKRRIRGTLNNNNKHFWFYLLYKKYIFLESIAWKKAVYTITFYIKFSLVGGYLKCSNDTPKLNIHKYKNNNFQMNDTAIKQLVFLF